MRVWTTAFVAMMLMASEGRPQSTSIASFFKGDLAKGDHYYDLLAYRNALQYYLHVLEKEPANLHARKRSAQCYLHLHDPINAGLQLQEAARLPAADDELKYLFAESQSMIGDYSLAGEFYATVLNSDGYGQTARAKVEFIKKLAYFKRDSGNYSIGGLPVNTGHMEFAPHYTGNGVVFVSTRDVNLFVKHQNLGSADEDETLANLFYAPLADGRFGDPEHFTHENIKTHYHEGSLDFFNDFNRVVFTRSNLEDRRADRGETGHTHLNLYFAETRNIHAWQNITEFPYNDDHHSVAQPAINESGTLLIFSSDKPGGRGGADLYMSEFVDGRWDVPVNLGPRINTGQDEYFPFLMNDSTLIFSSNGFGSFGGTDLYISYLRGAHWTAPINLGYPLNSSWDDFALITDASGRKGLFTSNRPGGRGGDDIYSFISERFPLVGRAVDRDSVHKSIPGVTIVIHDREGNVISKLTTDEDGLFLADLPYDSSVVITAYKDGYELLKDVPFSTQNLRMGIDSVFIPMWRHQLFARGRVFSNESQQLLTDAKVILDNITDGTMDSISVNDKGEYSFLVYPDKKYKIDAQHKGFLDNGFNLNTSNLYSGELLNDIVLEEKFVDKGQVLFDYDKDEIKPEATAELEKVLRSLRKFSELTLYIGAHADSRGSLQYNQELSDRRAVNTVRFFTSRGISRRRIEARGFGEELLLNRCSDGVDCPEEEHTKNRRAEMKVQVVTPRR
jgi:outer membrane protein OmpA-like peptidoglycan-associated protein